MRRSPHIKIPDAHVTGTIVASNMMKLRVTKIGKNKVGCYYVDVEWYGDVYRLRIGDSFKPTLRFDLTPRTTA